MERKGGMTHGRRKSGGSPSKWQPLSSSLQSPSWTLHSLHKWSRTTACFYSCIRKNFTRLYLFVSACCYLASFLRDNHTSLIRTPSCWNSSASPSPHSPSSRIGPPKQTFLNSPSTSPLTIRCTPSQSRSSTAAEECSSGVTSRQKRHEKLATSASFLPARFCDVLTIGSPTPAICPPALHSARQCVHSSLNDPALLPFLAASSSSIVC